MVKKIIKLVPHKIHIQGDVIEVLEFVLAKARKGGINGVAIACSYTDGSISSTTSESDCYGQLLGAIAIMQHQYAGRRVVVTESET